MTTLYKLTDQAMQRGAPAMRGIIFRDDMIRAILEGCKTQTRRMNRRWLRLRRGDLLYVKETWFLMDRPRWYTDMLPLQDRVFYREECLRGDLSLDPEVEHGRKELGYKWRSPLHMPAAYSRLILEATEDARPERIQDIFDDDARAEGVQSRDEFRALWEEIHPEGWEENPEVVVICFREVNKP